MTDKGRLYEGRVTLVTGGTKGIGLATALKFGSHGAQTILTYRWGSADNEVIKRRFADLGAPEPLFFQADVASETDTAMLFETIKDRFGRIDAFISNASNAATVRSLDDLTERAFLKSMRATAWPTVAYVLAAKRYLGLFPRYVVVMSSDGSEHFTPAYDFVAAGKAAAETLSRYLAYHLRDQDFRINVLRSRAVKTDAFDDIFGQEFYDFLRRFVDEGWFMSPDDVADAALALCSGMFDAMSGEVIMADRGNTFADGISLLYEDRDVLDL